jgi:CBS domain-containing protein
MNTALDKVLEKKGRHVYVTSPMQTVLDAVKSMKDKQVGALIVVDDGKPVGVFTERDVLNRVVAAERDPSKTSVSEVMTKNVAAVEPATTVQQAMAIVTNMRYRHLPVMEGDELAGVVSIGDLTHWLANKQNFEIESLLRYIAGTYPG